MNTKITFDSIDLSKQIVIIFFLFKFLQWLTSFNILHFILTIIFFNLLLYHNVNRYIYIPIFLYVFFYNEKLYISLLLLYKLAHIGFFVKYKTYALFARDLLCYMMYKVFKKIQSLISDYNATKKR
jgi:hypothetical protein